MLNLRRTTIHFAHPSTRSTRLRASFAQGRLSSVAANRRLKMERQEERGIAYGEAASISSPPSRSQMDGRVESGFGGWVDERVETAREAVPLLSRKNLSTTFDNSSMTMRFWAFSIDRIVILILQIMPTDIKQRKTNIHFAHCVRSVAATCRNRCFPATDG